MLKRLFITTVTVWFLLASLAVNLDIKFKMDGFTSLESLGDVLIESMGLSGIIDTEAKEKRLDLTGKKINAQNHACSNVLVGDDNELKIRLNDCRSKICQLSENLDHLTSILDITSKLNDENIVGTTIKGKSYKDIDQTKDILKEVCKGLKGLTAKTTVSKAEVTQYFETNIMGIIGSSLSLEDFKLPSSKNIITMDNNTKKLDIEFGTSDYEPPIDDEAKLYYHGCEIKWCARVENTPQNINNYVQDSTNSKYYPIFRVDMSKPAQVSLYKAAYVPIGNTFINFISSKNPSFRIEEFLTCDSLNLEPALVNIEKTKKYPNPISANIYQLESSYPPESPIGVDPTSYNLIDEVLVNLFEGKYRPKCEIWYLSSKKKSGESNQDVVVDDNEPTMVINIIAEIKVSGRILI